MTAPAPEPVPAGAITAATKALHKITLMVPCPEDDEIARAVLEAAAPLIRQAERDRIRQLATERGARYGCGCGDGDWCYESSRRFADLIGGS